MEGSESGIPKRLDYTTSHHRLSHSFPNNALISLTHNNPGRPIRQGDISLNPLFKII